MKFCRLRNRVYHDGDGTLQVRSHAEYGILKKREPEAGSQGPEKQDGEYEIVARIVRNGSKWIALQITDGNKFGKPVSPMNYVLLRDVKEWVLERFSSCR